MPIPMPLLVTRLVRFLVPRNLRNMLRRPRVTIRRGIAKARRCFGNVSLVAISDTCLVNCHPLCEEEFSVFMTEPEQRAEMSGFVAATVPGMRLLDIGAHWGAFTLAALHHGGEDASCLDIEASAAAADVLEQNLRLNGQRDRVILIRAACGDKEGEIRMLSTGAGGADYFVVPCEERSDSTIVRQTTADAVCREHHFHPTHVKIDVEGYEEEVLRGAQATLKEARPIVFLELHGDLIRRRQHNPEVVLNLLEETGHTNWRSVDGIILTRKDMAKRGHNIRIVAVCA